MFKKWSLLLLFISLNVLFASQTPWAIGPQMSFVIPKSNTSSVYELKGATASLGLPARVYFDLGDAGELAYTPVVDFWFRKDSWSGHSSSDWWRQSTHTKNVDLTDWMLNMSFFEMSYFPPLSKVLRPYVGFGLLSIQIHGWKQEFDWSYNTTPANYQRYSNSDTGAGVGANIFLGLELATSSTIRPLFEIRGSGSSAGPNAFKMNLGLLFMQK